MPFTTFHFGPGILIGLLALKYLDFPTFVAANLVVDWRAALVFLGVWPFGGPLHSWLSTYPGALLSGAILSVAMVYIRPHLQKNLEDIKIKQGFSNRKILLSALLGVLIHVTLDAFHHPNIQPFLVEGVKPFFGLMTTSQVRGVTFACILACFPIY
ncbi:MAG: hypothetical protein J07AB43_12790, partial [Candidatus Nanosalina sp. J07AB43]